MIDVFRIGVHLGFQSNGAGVLNQLMRGLTGVEVGAKRVNEQFSRMRTLAISAGAAFGGIALIRMLDDVAKHGAKVADIQAKMRGLGISEPNIRAATASAFSNAQNIRGTTPAGNLGADLELRGILPNIQDAIAAAPQYLKTAFDLGIYNDSQARGDMLALVKGMDLKGGFTKNGQLDVGAFNHALRSAEAALELTNGLLTGKSFYQFTRMAGPAAAALNTDQYLKDDTEAMMALGSTGGRGMQMAAKTFLGGQFTKANITQLEHLGLISSRNVLKDHGHYALRSGAALKGYNELLNKGFAQWFRDVVKPAMERHHFTGKAAVLQALSSLPVTEQRLFSFWYTNWAQTERFSDKFDQRSGVDTNKALQDTSYSANMRDFQAAWEGLLQALGAAVVPGAITVLQNLTTAVLKLEEIAVSHPGAAAVIVDMTAALGGVLTVGGTLGVATFALKGFGSALGLFATGTKAASGLTMLGAGAGVAGSLASFAVGIGEVAAAATLAYNAFKGWSDLNQKEPSTTGLKNPNSLPTIGSSALPDHGLPRVLPHGLYFGAMPPPPPSLVPPSNARAANSNWFSDDRKAAMGSGTLGTAQNPIHTLTTVTNGKDLVTGVTRAQADAASRPKSGPTGFDTRVSPLMPGFDPAMMTGP